MGANRTTTLHLCFLNGLTGVQFRDSNAGLEHAGRHNVSE
jgi:hypothetical protein